MKKKIIITISVILGIILGSSLVWSSKSYKPNELAIQALNSDKKIEVKNDKFISFTPKDKEVEKGFIFYPGAGVEPEAYAPICREIALKGYEVVIAKMPLNLAILSPNKADKIISSYNNIKTWAIGGHSLGGVMASKYASNHDDIKAVAFYASYPSNDELKDLDLEVLSLYGEKDGVLNKGNLAKSKENLPSDAKFIEIKGGNHSQFGDYGLQNGDEKASITEEKQFETTANYTIEVLDKIE